MRLLLIITLVAFTLFLNAQVENGCISIDFETFPNEVPVSGLVLSDQYKDAFGLSFILEGGGFPVLAQVGGDPAEAFGSAWGNDTPAPGVDIGQFFLTDDGQLSGLTSPPMILEFEIPIDSFAGCILDMDFGEIFIIQALDESGTVILEEIIEAGDPGTGDGALTCWGFNLPGCEGSIYSIKYAGSRQTAGAFGLGLDYFSFCYSGLQIDTETTPATCDGLGSLDIFSVTNEVYEYSLDGVNYSLNGSYDNLSEGVYDVFVRDSDNCTTTVEVTIDSEVDDLPDPIFVEEEICNGQSYIFNGIDYSDAGMYQQILSATNGCDTVWNLSLSVLPGFSETINAEICDGETYELNDQVYSMAGVYEQALTTSQGCDSILILQLESIGIPMETVNVEICEGETFELNGESYTTGGSFRQFVTSVAGCDSIIDINLDINPNSEELVTASICVNGFYDLNGEIYTSAGSYTQQLTNSFGCDSILKLELGVIDLTTEIIAAQICEGEVYEVNGQIYTTAGIYTQNLTGVTGCDSILTIELELVPASIGVLSEEVCEGGTVTVNGVSYNSAGSYSQNLVSSVGCDSLLEIRVAIIPAAETCESISIFEGEELNLNGVSYSVAGTYEQTLQTIDGCDSILIIKLEVLPMPTALLHYDLNNCAAGGYSYDEFVARYKEGLDCADINASILYRPSGLIHSCTPGESGSGMCVSSDPACIYQNESVHRLIFEVQIDPISGPLTIAGLNFFEKAPIRYEFNAGGTGVNNYPTLFAFKIIKDTTVIYSKQSVSTNREWTQQSFGFSGLTPFVFDKPSTLTVEFLAFCPIGVASNVSAWDIDELSLLGYCQPDGNKVTGNIMTSKIEPLSDVTISVKDSNTWRSYMSDDKGEFAFNTDYGQAAVTIEPVYDNDPLKGVSTLDLIYIQRHILGSESFDEFADFVAADINKDEKINTMDLIELRKLILGVNDNFTQNTSWRFIEANKEYYFLSQLYDQMIITGLDEEINLKAVKVGDVNQSYTVNTNKTKLDFRYFSDYKIIVRNYTNDNGEKVIGFFASEKANLSGLQVTFKLEGRMELTIVPHKLYIADQNYHLTEDMLKICWNNQNQEIIKGELLFEFLCNECTIDGNIYLDSDVENEIYHAADLVAQSIVLEYDNEIREQAIVDAIQLNVHPNPFRDIAKIQILSKEKITTQYEIVDATGKLIKSESVILESGANDIGLNKTDLPGVGIYFIIIRKDQSVYRKRVVLY